MFRQVLENDGFSEWLCQICWLQTKTFHEFYKRLEDIHRSHAANEATKLFEIKVRANEPSDRPMEEILVPNLNIVKYEATDTNADLVTDMKGNVEICKEEFLQYDDDDASVQGRLQSNVLSWSELLDKEFVNFRW